MKPEPTWGWAFGAVAGTTNAVHPPGSPNRRIRVPFALLYLAEGAPIGFVWWALPTWLRVEGVPVNEITALTSLLVLPWVLKFLWAPLVDRIRNGRAGLRGWIVTAQVVMGLTLLPLTWLDMGEHLGTIRLLLLAHALAAATQDVSVDALALRIVPEAERGRLNGAMQAGMLAGRSLFGGGALVVAAAIGWPAVILALIACIWICLPVVLFISEPPSRPTGGLPGPPVLSGMTAVLKRRTVWLGLLFALTAAAGFEVTGALAGPMLVDRGLDQKVVGWVLGVPVVGATIAGGLLGGFLADRFGHGRVVMAGMASFSAAVLMVAAANPIDALPPAIFFGLLSILYLCIGVFTAASYALFMDLSRPPLAATQFSAFMAATNGCEAWSVWRGGWLAAKFSYSTAFIAMTVVSLLSLLLVSPLLALARRDRIERKAPASGTD